MTFRLLAFAAASLLFVSGAFAQTPPPGSTGICGDGSYSHAATEKGACSHHGGVKTWMGNAAPAAAPNRPAPPMATNPNAAPAPMTPSAPATAPMGRPTAMPQPAAGGAGMVWVNTSSHVYHCTGDRWYGKTKAGAYMSESDALAKGNRADHGKACH